jgi:hypothetical protein
MGATSSPLTVAKPAVVTADLRNQGGGVPVAPMPRTAKGLTSFNGGGRFGYGF